jgi:hypothetical protein
LFPRTARGYSLGTAIVDGSPIEASWGEGLLFVNKDKSSAREWLFAANARQISPATNKVPK